MTTVFMRRLSRWQAESQREDFADLYLQAYRDPFGDTGPDRQQFGERFAYDVQQPEFEMLVASDPSLVGCAYGFRVDRDSAWWEQFETVPTEIDEATSVRQVFLIAELMVLPHQRRRHVAGRLHDQVLSRTDAPLAITLLDPGNGPARAAFQTWGWTKAGELTPTDGGAPSETWAKELTG